MTIAENPHTVHGRLLEATHLAGYSASRATLELEYLLDENRWQDLGFNDFNAFLATINLSEFKFAIEQRRGLAKRLEEIGASQRATARVLGVNEVTVARDLGKDRGATNVAPESPSLILDPAPVATNVAAPAFARPATEVTEVVEREVRKEERRIESAEREKIPRPAPAVGTYSTLVIDPPWPMEKIERDVRPNQVGFDYPTMTEEQLAALHIPTAEAAHLYLWTTHKFLPMALRLAEGWGFNYQCLMTWRKNVGFTPFSWMYSTEHVLFCTRGGLEVQRKGLRLDFDAKVREHSRKPDEFYDLVRVASPGPRIDMFSRETREGFNSWGAETGILDA